jgi:hypothetical protein
MSPEAQAAFRKEFKVPDDHSLMYTAQTVNWCAGFDAGRESMRKELPKEVHIVFRDYEYEGLSSPYAAYLDESRALTHAKTIKGEGVVESCEIDYALPQPDQPDGE